MVSRNTSVLLAVAIIAIGAVAIIGVAYAYTAITENTGNTSGSIYIKLDQGNTTADYTNAFNGSVKFDTSTDSTGTTYTLNQEQLTPLLTAQQTGKTEVKAICLGTKTIDVVGVNNGDFKFSVTNKTANKMTGTFYIGITIGSGTEQIRLFDTTTNTANYYKITADADHGAIRNITDAGAIDDATTSITVSLYVSAMNSSTSLVKPLDGVTFEFKAEVPEPVTS